MQDGRIHLEYGIQQRDCCWKSEGAAGGDADFARPGFVYRPVRYHDAAKLLQSAAEKLIETDRIGLVSAAVSDHPEIDYLCGSLLEKGGSLSFSSLRADTLSNTEILSALESSEHQAVAIAPEAGSERLRRVINKNLSEEQIYRAAEMLAQKGILNIKLYFMIGLPTETQKTFRQSSTLQKASATMS